MLQTNWESRIIRVLTLVDNLGIVPGIVGSNSYGQRVLDLDSVDLIRRALAREREIKKGIFEAVDPETAYSIDELERLGVPVGPIFSLARSGKIPVETESGARRIRGEDILEFFQKILKFNFR